MGNAPLHHPKNPAPPPEIPPPDDDARRRQHPQHHRVGGGDTHRAAAATSHPSTGEASTSSPPNPSPPDGSANKKSGSLRGLHFHHRHHGKGGHSSLRTFEGLVKRAAGSHSHSHHHKSSKPSSHHSKHGKAGGAHGSAQEEAPPLSPRSRRRRHDRMARARERVGRHLLVGCGDAEEHLAVVAELCLAATGSRGADALGAMGFEYRVVHGTECRCEGVSGRIEESDDASVVAAATKGGDGDGSAEPVVGEAATGTGTTASATTDADTSSAAGDGGPSSSTGGPPPVPHLHPMVASQPRSISMELRDAMEHWNVGHSHDVPTSGSGGAVRSQFTSACASPLTIDGGEVEMTGSGSGDGGSSGGEGGGSSSSGDEGGSGGDESSPSSSQRGDDGGPMPDHRRRGHEVVARAADAAEAEAEAEEDDAAPPSFRFGGAGAPAASASVTPSYSTAGTGTGTGGIELTNNSGHGGDAGGAGTMTRCETAEALLRGSSSSSSSEELELAVPLGVDTSDHGGGGGGGDDDDDDDGEVAAAAAAADDRSPSASAAGGGEEKKDGDDAATAAPAPSSEAPPSAATAAQHGAADTDADDALLEGFGDRQPGHIARLGGREDQDRDTSTTKSPSPSDAPPAPSLMERVYQHSLYHRHLSPENAADCTVRLVHVDSSTVIDDHNRRLYIADGDMYEAVTNAAQEFAQDLMVEGGDLEWITICDDKTQGEPIRALVDRRKPSADDPSSSPADEKTLLIATGKGKVRAGIFSRKHLLTTGIEPSTALPLVQQARQRNMRIVILDPNARGERLGMDTFEMSMEKIFVAKDDTEGCRPSSSTWENPGVVDDAAIGGGESISTSSTYQVSNNTNGLYILAHSASGAQLVRYFLDKQLHPTGSGAVAAPAEATSRKPTCANIQNRAITQTQQQHHDGADSSSAAFRVEAIAFTDSTHNVQWTKKNPCLRQLLENDNSMYLRSAHQHDSQPEEWHRSQTGAPVDTDEHWKHRFGDVKTMWAGTKAHELINWTGRQQIWDHFDAKSGTNSGSDDGGSSEPSNEIDGTKKGDCL